MKMSKESYSHILNKFKENQQKISDALPSYSENEYYQKNGLDFRKAVAWDSLRAFVEHDNGVKTGFIRELYNDEGLNDSHIQTGIMKALKELKIIS